MVKYYVTSAKGNIYCTNGERYSPQFVGPGTGHSAKTWKTLAGAQRFAARVRGVVLTVK